MPLRRRSTPKPTREVDAPALLSKTPRPLNHSRRTHEHEAALPSAHCTHPNVNGAANHPNPDWQAWPGPPTGRARAHGVPQVATADCPPRVRVCISDSNAEPMPCAAHTGQGTGYGRPDNAAGGTHRRAPGTDVFLEPGARVPPTPKFDPHSALARRTREPVEGRSYIDF